MIISLKIEHIEKIEYEQNIRDDGDEEKLLFIYSNFLISSIELLFIIFTQYVDACDTSDNLIMNFIL